MSSISSAQFFLFLHIAAALWMTAGVFSSAVVRVQARKSLDVSQKVVAYRLLWRLHIVYTLPGLIVAGFLGFYLVTARGYGFNPPWVVASSLVYLFLFLSSLFFLTPSLSHLSGAAEAALTDDEARTQFDTLAAGKLWGILSDVNALGILVLVFLMTVKP